MIAPLCLLGSSRLVRRCVCVWVVLPARVCRCDTPTVASHDTDTPLYARRAREQQTRHCGNDGAAAAVCLVNAPLSSLLLSRPHAPSLLASCASFLMTRL